MDYKNAGVDIEAGYKSVELMKQYVQGTMRPEVLGGIGGFSGAFSAAALKNMEEPTLLSGTDGVGTKLKLAFLMDKHDTVGIDCVAMCVNDVACAGGEPLFFLDYIACGKNVPEKIATIVKGVAEGCRQAGCALIGGETAGIRYASAARVTCDGELLDPYTMLRAQGASEVCIYLAAATSNREKDPKGAALTLVDDAQRKGFDALLQEAHCRL